MNLAGPAPVKQRGRHPTGDPMRHSRRACLALLLLAAPLAGQAADSTAPAPVGAPVVARGDTLFRLYGRLGPFGPAERADAAMRRLARLGPALAAGDSIVVAEVGGRSELLVGDEVLLSVLPEDAAPLKAPVGSVAAMWAVRLEQAGRKSQAAANLETLARDLGRAFAATVVLVLLLLALAALFRRLYAFLGSDRVPALRIKRFELLSAERLGEALTVAARGGRVVLTILLLYVYVPLVLSFFPWTAPYSRRIAGYILSPLHTVWNGFLDYLPKVFFLAVIVLVTRYLLKAIRLVFRALETGALTLQGFHREWAAPTFTIVRFLVVAFAAVVMFPYLPGAGSDAFKGVSLFVGVLLSFGSSGAVGNIVAGVVLTYTNAFRLGDRIQIGETMGDVMERTMLVTRIRTIKNVDITIPNATVLQSQVINYTTRAVRDGLILHTTVTIGYDVPWRQVHELLIGAAKATGNILPEPAPFVLQTSLDDFYVSYQLNAYTNRPAVMAVTYSDLHQAIQDAFAKAGVEIMSPHYGALRDGNPVALPPAALPKGYRAPAFRVERTEGSA